MSAIRSRFTAPALGLALALLALAPGARAGSDPFSANVLGGVQRLHVVVRGVPDAFARYGLTAAELERRATQRLGGYGIEVVSRAAALADPAASELRIELHANEDPFAFYFYRVGLELRRKRVLAGSPMAFIPESVWSEAQSGVLNPSDLPRVYGFVDLLLDKFIAAHDLHNGPPRTAASE